jgi:hypothetical protein
MSGIIRAVTAIIVALFLNSLASQSPAQTPPPPQQPANVLVTFVVTEDDTPASFSKITIRPMGTVEGWPEGKTVIELTTDLQGRGATRLGPGKYKVVAHQSMNSKLPADGWFAIKAGEQRPRKIFLKLLYWDCAHVTCML